METFIKKAIEGGWKDKSYEIDVNNDGVWVSNTDETLHQSDILLDPLAWQVVGKVEGWDKKCIMCENVANPHNYRHLFRSDDYVWQKNMHRMIDHLAEGKDIESYITSLFN